MLLASAAIISSTFLGASAQTYKLAQNFSGSTFFDRWTFQNGIDANTTGNVLFQTREQAQQLGIIGTTGAGNVLIKVDNKTSGVGNPTFGRPSVKLLSNDVLTQGSLLIMDAVHLPYGCSVWPAFWTQGSTWPDGGEIDIVENVNMATNNRYALHTLQGCQHTPAGQVQETGQLVQADCFNQTNGNRGCLINDPNPNSYGEGFAKNGGGAWATLWDDQGIRIWFFPRPDIPADLPTSNPNPSNWGTPVAFYSSTTCDFKKFFHPQTIIFDITLCGNFAALPQIFSQTCQGNCLDLVQTPTNYDNAYFEIRYLTLFTTGGASTNPSASQNAPSKSDSGTNPTTTSGNNGAISLTKGSGVFTILAIVVPFVLCLMAGISLQ